MVTISRLQHWQALPWWNACYVVLKWLSVIRWPLKEQTGVDHLEGTANFTEHHLRIVWGGKITKKTDSILTWISWSNQEKLSLDCKRLVPTSQKLFLSYFAPWAFITGTISTDLKMYSGIFHHELYRSLFMLLTIFVEEQVVVTSFKPQLKIIGGVLKMNKWTFSLISTLLKSLRSFLS